MRIVSLVVPVYCEEEVIEECYKRIMSVMDSLVNYDHELIFVNDGSTDNTRDKIKHIATKDTKLKIINFSRISFHNHFFSKKFCLKSDWLRTIFLTYSIQLI